MKLKILWALGLSMALSAAYSQPDKNVECDGIVRQNYRLANEKMELAKRLDSLTLVIERRGYYRRRIEYNDYYRNLFNRERAVRDSIERLNKSHGATIVKISKERDTLKEELEIIKNLDFTRIKGLKEMPEKTSINHALLEMAVKIMELEDELTDNVSLKFELIHFKGKNYKYGDEVIFIPYKGENQADSMVMSDSLTYSLNRFIQLVSKYDVGVKLKLEGKCCIRNDNKKKTKQNCIDRAENLKTHLKSRIYNLSDQYFADCPQDSNIDTQAGVSIRVVRK